ncbi:unnamed protein product, partial [Amoebophrya sp. A25]
SKERTSLSSRGAWVPPMGKAPPGTASLSAAISTRFGSNSRLSALVVSDSTDEANGNYNGVDEDGSSVEPRTTSTTTQKIQTTTELLQQDEDRALGTTSPVDD